MLLHVRNSPTSSDTSILLLFYDYTGGACEYTTTVLPLYWRRVRVYYYTTTTVLPLFDDAYLHDDVDEVRVLDVVETDQTGPAGRGVHPGARNKPECSK